MTVAAASKKTWTILEMLQWGTSYLAEKGFDESRLTIEILLSHVLRLKRIQLYTNFEKPLVDDELAAFKVLLQRRLLHEPVQYITGSTEFMGKEFLVDKRALIPRPETELLAELALRHVKENFKERPMHILDIGTGSGCLAICFAAMIANATVEAFDISPEAIELARLNAEKNGVTGKVNFSVKDALTITSADFPEKFDLIVSNPPYISKAEFDRLQPEIREFEPLHATTDGGDGLSFYRCIATVARKLLHRDGMVIVEHAYDQKHEVHKIFHEAGWGNLEAVKDYNGNPRCVVAKMQGEKI